MLIGVQRALCAQLVDLAAGRAKLTWGLDRSLGLLGQQVDVVRWLARSSLLRASVIRPALVVRAVANLPPLGVDLRAEIGPSVTVTAAPGAVETVISEFSMALRRAALPSAEVKLQAKELVAGRHSMDGLDIECSRSGVLIWLTAQIVTLDDDLSFPERILSAHDGKVYRALSGERTALGAFWPTLDVGWPLDAAEYGRVLRHRRERLDLTRAQLAVSSDVADSTIRNVETGRHRPTSAIRKKLIQGIERHEAQLMPTKQIHNQPGQPIR